jgi:hypothetical protein
MRRGGKGDAIPLIAFHNAPLFKAGFFTSPDISVSCILLQICIFPLLIETLTIDHFLLSDNKKILH